VPRMGARSRVDEVATVTDGSSRRALTGGSPAAYRPNPYPVGSRPAEPRDPETISMTTP
jgi:hypothetical protein